MSAGVVQRSAVGLRFSATLGRKRPGKTRTLLVEVDLSRPPVSPPPLQEGPPPPARAALTALRRRHHPVTLPC